MSIYLPYIHQNNISQFFILGCWEGVPNRTSWCHLQVWWSLPGNLLLFTSSSSPFYLLFRSLSTVRSLYKLQRNAILTDDWCSMQETFAIISSQPNSSRWFVGKILILWNFLFNSGYFIFFQGARGWIAAPHSQEKDPILQRKQRNCQTVWTKWNQNGKICLWCFSIHWVRVWFVAFWVVSPLLLLLTSA